MKSGIYIIRNTINKKVYIGSAVNLYRRFHNHKSNLLKNKHCNTILQNFVNKYGFNTLSFNILEEVKNKKNLIKREQIYIDSYKFKDLFNICKVAGSRLGTGHTEASRKKISESKKGIPRSEATREKISVSTKGKIISSTTRKKMSESQKGNTNWLGKKHTEATRKKISKVQLKTVLIFKDNVLIDTVVGVVIVAKKYNLNRGSISAVCLGKQKTTGGYTMKYERT